MDNLEQYYTEDRIGERLVSMLPDVAPKNCVELSAGEGALLNQLLIRWPKLSITTCELDPNNVNQLRLNYPGNHYHLDVATDLFEKHFNGETLFDLSISNPPYSWIPLTAYHTNLLKEFGIESLFTGSRIRTEVIFILQYLKITANNGILAFILPDLIIASQRFSNFRKFLFSICTPLSIYEVKGGEFKGTEARTYIITLVKNNRTTCVEYTNSSGLIRKITIDELIYGFRNLPAPVTGKYLINSCFIRRGTLTGKECKSLEFPYYHTSGFNKNDRYDNISHIRPVRHSGKLVVYAEPRDILISRVGSRVLGEARIVTNGVFAISDCVFIIRLNKPDNPQDFITFWKKFFKDNKEILSKGTCAKYITKDVIERCLHDYFSTQEFLNDRLKFS